MNIDSSNMDTSHISSISECIMNNYNDYDGFVITHGTDTCAYTAAALSYQLINLSKPVILTGSQLPIDVEKTDAVMNLTNAFIYSCEDISGVFLAFSEKLIKGTCAKKIKTKSFDAFESINFPYIATIRNNIVEYNINTFENIMTSCNGFHIKTDMCTDIAVITLFPGMNYNIFDYLNSSCRGVIIEVLVLEECQIILHNTFTDLQLMAYVLLLQLNVSMKVLIGRYMKSGVILQRKMS